MELIETTYIHNIKCYKYKLETDPLDYCNRLYEQLTILPSIEIREQKWIFNYVKKIQLLSYNKIRTYSNIRRCIFETTKIYAVVDFVNNVLIVTDNYLELAYNINQLEWNVYKKGV